jgi:hypothetical protein
MIWEDEIEVPAAVGILRYGFTDIDGTTPGYAATATVQLLDDTDNVIRQARIANLVQHLTTAERDGLIAMMTRLRALAVTELIP